MAWKTLARFGVHGRTVRVVEENSPTRGKRIVVVWRERALPGVKRKSKRSLFFDASPDGKREAVAAAEGVAERLKEVRRSKVEVAPPTLHELFERFATIREPMVRAVTMENYRRAWRKWEIMWTGGLFAEYTTLDMLDQFIAQETRLGRSINVTRILVQIIRGIYRWAFTRRLLPEDPFDGYKWVTPKDAKRHDPGEYRQPEFEAMLGQLDPMSSRDWRGHAVMMLVGHQGVRIRTALHLRWEFLDLERGRIVWPPRYIKKGKEFDQPLTFGGYAALLTARYHAARSGYTGPWVFFGSRSERWGTAEEKPVTYGAMYLRLRAAEDGAGVKHEAFRAFHGKRRMVVGDLYDETGDIKGALEMVGDDDVKMARSYLKKRSSRVERAAEIIDARVPKASPKASPKVTPAKAAGTRRRNRLGDVGLAEWLKASDGTRTHDPSGNAHLHSSVAGVNPKVAGRNRPEKGGRKTENDPESVTESVTSLPTPTAPARPGEDES